MARRLQVPQARMSLDAALSTMNKNGEALRSPDLGGLGSRRHRLASRLTAVRRGFTLVELAIVVAIVGVLSVVAVVGYRKLVLTGKVSEAQNVISAIRIAQEDYKVERGIYADIGSGPCPRSGLTQVKTQWDPACSGGKNQWNLLPVHVDGPVQFGYSTVAPPEAIPATVAWVDTSKADLTKPWYVIYAVADLDGNGGLSTELVGSSFTNTIFSQNVGQ